MTDEDEKEAREVTQEVEEATRTAWLRFKQRRTAAINTKGGRDNWRGTLVEAALFTFFREGFFQGVEYVAERMTEEE